jgi:hypothetical protein
MLVVVNFNKIGVNLCLALSSVGRSLVAHCGQFVEFLLFLLESAFLQNFIEFELAEGELLFDLGVGADWLLHPWMRGDLGNLGPLRGFEGHHANKQVLK